MATTAPTTNNLAARALAAHEAEEQENIAASIARKQEEERRERERLAYLLRRYLDIEVADDAITLPDTTIDGIRFSQTRCSGYPHGALHASDTCPRCGGTRYSWPITSLASLGNFLAGNDDGSHSCARHRASLSESDTFSAETETMVASPVTPPSIEARLVDVLRDLVIQQVEAYRAGEEA